ncbi:MAG: class I SAM-dependent methyltransferase [Magnetospirillum sp.]
MASEIPDFYQSYASYKRYETPNIGRKQIARFDTEVWGPAAFSTQCRVLELGCGTGAFLAYLAAKGITQMVGIDHDPALADVVPENVRSAFRCADVWTILAYLAAKGITQMVGIDHDPALADVVPENVRSAFRCADVWTILADPDLGQFDRVAMFDVLEHFTADEALRLLQSLRPRLNPGARLILKVPNAACPWALQYQFGDLTHRTAFTPLSMRQLADAAGYEATHVYAQRQGSRRRMITDALVHRFLSWALLTPPEFWSANMYAVLVAK